MARGRSGQLVDNMTSSLHEHDFYAWTQQQADILKSGSLTDLDTHYLIEELESMGASERRELVRRLTILLGHLLKWAYQPERRSKSWTLTIKGQRLEIKYLLKDNPSLKSQLGDKFSEGYEKAILLAADETGLEESAFPAESPFTLQQALDETYFPA